MTRGLNKVMIIGQLVRDPEMRYTPSGRPVTSFSLASSRTWITSEGERREDTEWFNVVTWGGLAEICKQHLHKGQTIYVEGRLQTHGWEDPEGKKHYRTEIVASEMIMLGDRRADASASPPAPRPSQASGSADVDIGESAPADEDFPF